MKSVIITYPKIIKLFVVLTIISLSVLAVYRISLVNTTKQLKTKIENRFTDNIKATDSYPYILSLTISGENNELLTVTLSNEFSDLDIQDKWSVLHGIYFTYNRSKQYIISEIDKLYMRKKTQKEKTTIIAISNNTVYTFNGGTIYDIKVNNQPIATPLPTSLPRTRPIEYFYTDSLHSIPVPVSRYKFTLERYLGIKGWSRDEKFEKQKMLEDEDIFLIPVGIKVLVFEYEGNFAQFKFIDDSVKYQKNRTAWIRISNLKKIP